jgi:hypothetical protein
LSFPALLGKQVNQCHLPELIFQQQLATAKQVNQHHLAPIPAGIGISTTGHKNSNFNNPCKMGPNGVIAGSFPVLQV